MKGMRAASVVAVAALVGALMATSSAGAATIPPGHATIKGHSQVMKRVGHVSPGAVSKQALKSGPKISQQQIAKYMGLVDRAYGSHVAQAAPAGAQTPSPKVIWPIVNNSGPSFTGGFAGTDTNDSWGASGIQVEPPDQGLCVGGGTVMETVNLDVQFYSTSGTPLLQSPMSLYTFFGIPGFNPTTFNPLLSDPRCYYDPTNGLWYSTALLLNQNGSGKGWVYLAVTDNSNPLQGWDIYRFSTTNIGDPGCPCFGDQPWLGTDANGIYITTNEFSIFNGNFNGSQVYAISKVRLGVSQLRITHYNLLNAPLPGIGGNNQVYSMQPTLSNTGTSSTAMNGTEYLMGTTDYVGAPGDINTSVLLGAITGTNGLNSVNSQSGNLLLGVIQNTIPYQFPVLANQKFGPTPYGDSLVPPVQEQPVQTNDDRMLQTWWTGSNVWGMANSAIQTPGAPLRTAPVYFAVKPTFGAGGAYVTGTVSNQGYIATDANTFFPSVVGLPSGKVLVAMNVSGSNYFPSGAYTIFSPGPSAKSSVYIYAPGQAPQDGFTQYLTPPTSGRWGDYSAGVAYSSGSAWFANEWIPGVNQNVAGGQAANWGTYIGSASG